MTSKHDAAAPRSRSLVQRLLRGGAVSLVARVVAVVGGLGIQMVLARALQPSDLGVYLLAQSIVVAGARFGQLGLHRTAVRSIASSVAAGLANQARGVILPTLHLALLGGATVAVLYFILLGPLLTTYAFESPALFGILTATSIWILAMTLQNVAAEVFRGFHAIGRAVAFGGALTNALLAGGLTALWFGKVEIDLQLACWLAVLALGTNVVAALIFLSPYLGTDRVKPERGYSMLLRGAVSLTLASALVAITDQLDLWIVGAILDEDSVALFGSAKRLIRIVSLPLVIMNLVVPPLIAELDTVGDTARLERAVRGAASLAGLPALGVLGVLLFARVEILEFFYGEWYGAGGVILALLTFERIAFVWSGPCGLALMMTGHERVMLGVTSIGAIATAAFAAIGANMGGAEGTALGVAMAGLIRHGLMWFAARRNCGVRTDMILLGLPAAIAAARRGLRS